jgi:hypothetical protein
VIENMLLPGHIENWVVISDMGHHGISPSNLSSLKQVIKVLTDNYRCRLGVNYVLNPPKTVYFIWSCIKPFLDDVLIEKIKIIKSNYSPELLAHCNHSQLEVKFGGHAPNLTKYWPPYIPNSNFRVERLSDIDDIHKTGLNQTVNAEPSEFSVADTKISSIIKCNLLGDNRSEKVKIKENGRKEEIATVEECEESAKIEENMEEEVKIVVVDEEEWERKEKKRRRKEKKLRKRKNCEEIRIAIEEKDEGNNEGLVEEINTIDKKVENEESVEKIIIEKKGVRSECSMWGNCDAFSRAKEKCTVI